jgi:hypothetical protein
MRTLLAVLMIAAIAVPAFAAGNPNITAYVTFDQGAEVARLDPTPYTLGHAYVCLKRVDAGFTTVSLAMAVDAGVSLSTSWASLLPGGLAIGAWPTGITISSTECMTGEYVCIGDGSFVWTGTAGMITVVDHPDYPRWVVDCVGGVDFYCLETNAGVFMDPIPTGEDCEPSPVEQSTWGGIKALYR